MLAQQSVAHKIKSVISRTPLPNTKHEKRLFKEKERKELTHKGRTILYKNF